MIQFARLAAISIACAISTSLPGAVALSAIASAEKTLSNTVHWSQFRGPNSSGVAPDCKPPVNLDPAQPSWKTAFAPGKSSPIIWNDRLFLTAIENGRLATLAIEASSGEMIWKRLAPEVPLEPVHSDGSPAASTPCADSSRVYAYFGSYGLLCYAHDGSEIWKKQLPRPQNMYGNSISSILYQNLLILLLDDDANLPDSKLSRSRVMALNKETGELVWETARPYNRSAWSTPVVWKRDTGTELVVLGNGRMYGYDLLTGVEKWYVSGFAREPIAVPVVGSNLLYASVSMQGGRGDVKLDPEPFWVAMKAADANRDDRIGRDEITKDFTLPLRPELQFGQPGWGIPLPSDPQRRREAQNRMFDLRDKDKDGFWTREEFIADMTFGFGQPLFVAVRPGGSGDVTTSHVNWKLATGIPEIPSPIYYQDRLYLVRDGGILTCVNATTGDLVYRQRLGPSGQYSASPVIADGHLYLFSTKGNLSVVKCGDTFELVHKADFKSTVAATPAIDKLGIYLRTEESLMAFR